MVIERAKLPFWNFSAVAELRIRNCLYRLSYDRIAHLGLSTFK